MYYGYDMGKNRIASCTFRTNSDGPIVMSLNFFGRERPGRREKIRSDQKTAMNLGAYAVGA
jgi:hypothetical protein